MKSIYLILLLISVSAMADQQKSLDCIFHAASNKITADMTYLVAKQKPGESVVLSAFSAMTPLAQLTLASAGRTHDELLAALGMPDDDVTKAAFSDLDSKLRSIDGVELRSASRVYIPLKNELNPEFAAVSRDVLHSEVLNVDFTSEKTVNDINAWVEEQTNHRIKDLVEKGSLDKMTGAVLINALYFKGKWDTPFRNSSTRNEDFHITRDKVVKVPMMHNTEYFKYGESKLLDSKILEMPYKGKQSSLLAILPNDVEGIDSLLEKLKDPSLLDTETNNLQQVEVEVSFPKFKIETTTNLIQVLQKMNVTTVFTDRADLGKLLSSPAPLKVDTAIQKAFIEVSEEGAEAAAANDVQIVLKMAMNTITFRADHPFLFYLNANNNNMQSNVLFSGIFYG